MKDLESYEAKMASEKRHVPRPIKRQLMEEAGDKCANPGCSNTKVEFHHIKHWAVYKVHDAADMIAVCPSCHDAVHHGRLKISDDTLYEWKKAKHSKKFHRDVLSVEGATEIGLLTGSMILATTNDALITFELSNKNTLAFRIEDGEIILVRSCLLNLSGEEVLSVSDNRIKVQRDKEITFERRPGRVLITAPASDRYIFPEMISQMRVQEPHYATDGRIVVLDLEVIKPGLVRVRGVWTAVEGGIIITEERIALLRSGLREPISLIGQGEATKLVFAGPVTAALFRFE